MRIETTNQIHNLVALEQQLNTSFPQVEIILGIKSGNRVYAVVPEDTDGEIVENIQNILDTFDETLEINKTSSQVQRETLENALTTELGNTEGKTLVGLTSGEQEALIRLMAYRLGLLEADGTLRSIREWLSA